MNSIKSRLCWAFTFLSIFTAPVIAQIAPNPPAQLCVNGKCANAPTAATASAAATTAAVKWHPGHYMNTAVYTTVGNLDFSGYNAGPEKAAEINAVRNGPAAVLGWGGYYTWASFYNNGTLDCSAAGSGFDADYALAVGYVSGNGPAGTAVYNKPRRVGITILQTNWFSPTANRILPSYIAGNSAYGPVGPNGTQYGYWTTNGAKGAGTGAVLALWRPAVMAQFQAFHAALGAHVLPDGWTVDTSPYIEWVKLTEETATLVPNGTTDSSYSLATLVTLLQGLNRTAHGAYPHTNVVEDANYLDQGGGFVASLASTATALGGPDIINGLSQGNNVPAITWGQAQYIGLVSPPSGNAGTVPWVVGGTNRTGVVPYIATEEADLITFSGAFTSALDLFNQANRTLRATHLAWTYTAGGATPTYANWFGNAANLAAWNSGGDTANGVLTTIVNNPLTNTACPSAYTGGCNTSP